MLKKTNQSENKSMELKRAVVTLCLGVFLQALLPSTAMAVRKGSEEADDLMYEYQKVTEEIGQLEQKAKADKRSAAENNRHFSGMRRSFSGVLPGTMGIEAKSKLDTNHELYRQSVEDLKEDHRLISTAKLTQQRILSQLKSEFGTKFDSEYKKFLRNPKRYQAAMKRDPEREDGTLNDDDSSDEDERSHRSRGRKSHSHKKEKHKKDALVNSDEEERIRAKAQREAEEDPEYLNCIGKIERMAGLPRSGEEWKAPSETSESLAAKHRCVAKYYKPLFDKLFKKYYSEQSSKNANLDDDRDIFGKKRRHTSQDSDDDSSSTVSGSSGSSGLSLNSVRSSGSGSESISLSDSAGSDGSSSSGTADGCPQGVQNMFREMGISPDQWGLMWNLITVLAKEGLIDNDKLQSILRPSKSSSATVVESDEDGDDRSRSSLARRTRRSEAASPDESGPSYVEEVGPDVFYLGRNSKGVEPLNRGPTSAPPFGFFQGNPPPVPPSRPYTGTLPPVPPSRPYTGTLPPVPASRVVGGLPANGAPQSQTVSQASEEKSRIRSRTQVSQHIVERAAEVLLREKGINMGVTEKAVLMGRLHDLRQPVKKMQEISEFLKDKGVDNQKIVEWQQQLELESPIVKGTSSAPNTGAQSSIPPVQPQPAPSVQSQSAPPIPRRPKGYTKPKAAGPAAANSAATGPAGQAQKKTAPPLPKNRPQVSAKPQVNTAPAGTKKPRSKIQLNQYLVKSAVEVLKVKGIQISNEDIANLTISLQSVDESDKKIDTISRYLSGKGVAGQDVLQWKNELDL